MFWLVWVFLTGKCRFTGNNNFCQEHIYSLQSGQNFSSKYCRGARVHPITSSSLGIHVGQGTPRLAPAAGFAPTLRPGSTRVPVSHPSQSQSRPSRGGAGTPGTHTRGTGATTARHRVRRASCGLTARAAASILFLSSSAGAAAPAAARTRQRVSVCTARPSAHGGGGSSSSL